MLMMLQMNKLFPIIIIGLLLIITLTVYLFDNNEDLKSDKSSIKIGIVADLHKCPSRKPDMITDELMNRLTDSFNNANVNFSVNLGDNISHRVSQCSKTADEDFNWVMTKLSSLNNPMYFILSDHDIKNKDSLEKWKKATNTPDTFYSFDYSDFHIIALDTITGKGYIDDKCTEVEICNEPRKKYVFYKKLLEDETQLNQYQKANNLSKEQIVQQEQHFKKIYEEEKAILNETRSLERWDQGQISQNQLEWLKKDLSKTKHNKIMIFSDHPLFSFSKEEKNYNIINLDKVTSILESANKEIVVISGEVHRWHEEKINGIQHYTMDELKSNNGSWALFTWDENGYHLEQITHQKE